MEVLEGFPNCSTKNLNKEPSHLAFFTALDPTEYWGMIREWVYLFLQIVKKRLQKAKHARVTLSHRVKRQHRIRSARLTLGFLSVAAYGLSKKSLRSDQRQFSLNIDKSKYTSVLKERLFSFCNTAVPVTRPHSLSNVKKHK